MKQKNWVFNETINLSVQHTISTPLFESRNRSTLKNSQTYRAQIDHSEIVSSRRSYSQLDALSFVLTATSSLQMDSEQKHLTPTSIGNSHMCHPCCRHCSMFSVYLTFFLTQASSPLDGDKNFNCLDHKTLKVVWIILGNTNFLPRSNLMFNLYAPSKIDDF